MKKQHTMILVLCMAVLLWITLIFILSSQTAEESGTFSRKVTAMMIKTVNRVWPLKLEHKPVQTLSRELDHTVRKYAHGAVYFVLSILVASVLKQIKVRAWKRSLISLCFCMLYALFDETFQIRVAGRTFEVKDLFADYLGILFGLGLFNLVGFICRGGKVQA